MTSLIRLRCPKCGRDDELDINANIWVRLTCDGTDADLADSRDHEWNDASHIRCVSCGHSGKVGEFEPNDYMAAFYTPAGVATEIFHAASPEQALRQARQYVEEGKLSDDQLDPVAEGYCVREITISTSDGETQASWMTFEHRLERTAPKLLAAAEAVITSWEKGDLASAVRTLAAIVEEAKSGAA